MTSRNKKTTSNKQTNWKEFDRDKKDVRNVNYDFTSSAPSADGSNLKVPRKNLLNKKLLVFGKVIRIYLLVLSVLAIVEGIISFFINQGIIIPSILIGLSTIELILVVVLDILVRKAIEYVPAMRNIYLPAIVFSVCTLGLSIGGLFMVKYLNYNLLALIEGVMFLAVDIVLANLHSFKKTAK